jgi:hypothetical protein
MPIDPIYIGQVAIAHALVRARHRPINSFDPCPALKAVAAPLESSRAGLTGLGRWLADLTTTGFDPAIRDPRIVGSTRSVFAPSLRKTDFR